MGYDVHYISYISLESQSLLDHQLDLYFVYFYRVFVQKIVFPYTKPGYTRTV